MEKRQGINSFAIITVGYNRPKSLLRLLESLQNAEYDGDKIPLIISIDYSGSDDVKSMAEAFQWKHGTKEIRCFPEQQGLRKHILSCGEFLDKYDAVCILEDDLIVSPYFYKFGKECLNYYTENDNIEGISLYSIKWNQNANFPFEPLKTDYDTYFMQYAQSWGQIWTKERFGEFFVWYKENEEFFEKEKREDIPAILYTWGKNSWLKYHIAYCIVKNKYFVYPYYSYSTAFAETGTHFRADLTRFHSEMVLEKNERYKLADFDNTKVLYDGFNENLQLKKYMEEKLRDTVAIDLYGSKEFLEKERYILSTQVLPYKIEKEYALQLRPIELNIYMDIKGTGIYLYNTSKPQKVSKKKRREQIVRKWNYFLKERFIMWHEIFPVCHEKIGNAIRIIIEMVRK